jgi:uncharacterized protein (DUF2126 family)
MASAGQDRALGSVIYRAFVPQSGLHPSIGANDPWVLEWIRGGSAVRAELHGWVPGGGCYDGLPRSAAEAQQRRSERVVVTKTAPSKLRSGVKAGSLDLRYLHSDSSHQLQRVSEQA